MKKSKILASQDETYCIKTNNHLRACTGTTHSCYRCGMYMGKCRCPTLGTLLDF